MTRFDYDDSDVVVVVGSGAGGGTVANELCQRGIRTVVLEAGPHLTGDDYHQDEWPAFGADGVERPAHHVGQLAGRRRTSRTCPPGWSRPSAGPPPTGPAPARGSRPTSSPRAATYGDVDGANLLDWPIALSELEPYYDKAEIKMGVTHRHGRPPLPANNNYKVFANGAEKLGYRHYSTGPYATNAEPYDGRPASACRTGSTSRATSRARSGPRSSPSCRRPRRPATSTCVPTRHATQILHDASGRATGVLYVDRNGALRRQRAVGGLRGRQRDRVGPAAAALASRRSTPTGSPTPPARWGATTCATPPAPCGGSSTSRCTCTAARRWPA